MYFCYFVIIFPWKMGDPLFEETLTPSPKKDLCQVKLKLSGGFGEEDKNMEGLRRRQQQQNQGQRRTTEKLRSEKLT